MPERTILVVDDEPSIRVFLSLALELEGFAVDLAASGTEALRMACADPPDAIVLDWLMPGMDGRDFLRAWRADPACPNVPVFVMTASDDRPRADELGVGDFITKPFDVDTLLSMLTSVL